MLLARQLQPLAKCSQKRMFSKYDLSSFQTSNANEILGTPVYLHPEAMTTQRIERRKKLELKKTDNNKAKVRVRWEHGGH